MLLAKCQVILVISMLIILFFLSKLLKSLGVGISWSTNNVCKLLVTNIKLWIFKEVWSLVIANKNKGEVKKNLWSWILGTSKKD